MKYQENSHYDLAQGNETTLALPTTYTMSLVDQIGTAHSSMGRLQNVLILCLHLIAFYIMYRDSYVMIVIIDSIICKCPGP